MKIWFDISNSPHINMFEYLMKDLTREGHEIIVTSRPLANTIDLLNQKNKTHNYWKTLWKELYKENNRFSN